MGNGETWISNRTKCINNIVIQKFLIKKKREQRVKKSKQNNILLPRSIIKTPSFYACLITTKYNGEKDRYNHTNISNDN